MEFFFFIPKTPISHEWRDGIETRFAPLCQQAMKLFINFINSLFIIIIDMNDFVCSCDEWGDFETVQCLLHYGICWCVDPTTGIQLQGTQTRGLPDCSNSNPGRS